MKTPGLSDLVAQVELHRHRAEVAERRIAMVLRSKVLRMHDGNVILLRGEDAPVDDDDVEGVLSMLRKLNLKNMHLVVLPFGASLEVLSEKERQELKSSL